MKSKQVIKIDALLESQREGQGRNQILAMLKQNTSLVQKIMRQGKKYSLFFFWNIDFDKLNPNIKADLIMGMGKRTKIF